jgi:hypothetical protein
MGWFSKLREKTQAQALPEQRTESASVLRRPIAPPVAPPHRPPAAPALGLLPTRLSSDGRLSVVGESHYQAALHSAVGGRNAYGWDNAVAVRAVLVPEPGNKYDRNAVRVDVNGRPVGYLAREDAIRYQPPLLDLQEQGRSGWCPAFISSGDIGLYGIWLHLSSPDRLVALNSSDGLEMLQADRQVTVTGEERHQDVLTEYAKAGRGAEVLSVFASLAPCTIAKGKHAGAADVEVRLDGRRVGELTAAMSERYLPLLQPYLEQGALPGADATIRWSDKGWQVGVQLPKVA